MSNSSVNLKIQTWTCMLKWFAYIAIYKKRYLNDCLKKQKHLGLPKQTCFRSDQVSFKVCYHSNVELKWPTFQRWDWLGLLSRVCDSYHLKKLVSLILGLKTSATGFSITCLSMSHKKNLSSGFYTFTVCPCNPA